MKRLIMLVLLVGLVALAVAGCGGSSAAKVAANPKTKQDLRQGEVIVKACLTKSRTPKGFTACVAPKGHEVALQACATKALTHDLPFHKARLTPDLAECVVQNR